MKKLRLSATQVELFQRCPRQWFYQYVLKIKPKPNQNQGLGLRVHQILEEYNKKGTPPPRNETYQFAPDTKTFYPGRIALLALPRLPKPGTGVVEGKFLLKGTYADYLGYIDLELPTRIIDFKTSSDPKRWGKNPGDLKTDPQGVLYSMKKFLDKKISRVTLEWLYLKTTGKGKAHPVEIETERETIESEFQKIEQQAKIMGEVVATTCADVKGCHTLPPNPSMCFVFGGCPHQERCDLTEDQKLEALMDSNDLLSKLKGQIKDQKGAAATSAINPPESKTTAPPQDEDPDFPKTDVSKQEKPKKPKRNRRTKKQIALDNAKEAWEKGEATTEQEQLLLEANIISGEEVVEKHDSAIDPQVLALEEAVEAYEDNRATLKQADLLFENGAITFQQHRELYAPDKASVEGEEKNAPIAKAGPAREENGLDATLCIGCTVITSFRKVTLFENLLKASGAVEKVNEHLGLPTYRLKPYREGIAMVAAQLKKELEDCPNLLRDTTIVAAADLEREYREVLVPFCSAVYEATPAA